MSVADYTDELREHGWEYLKTVSVTSHSKVLLVRSRASGMTFVAKARTHISEATSYAKISQLHDCEHFARVEQILPDPTNKDCVTIVMEYFPSGDLFRLNGKCDEYEAKTLTYQMLCALRSFHAAVGPHGDVKLENFLLREVRRRTGAAADDDDTTTTTTNNTDNARCVCLVDFGPSGGSKNYLAPELLRAATHSAPRTPTEQSDLFAVGVCLYVLLSGHYPFYDVSETTWYKNVMMGSWAPLPAAVSMSAGGKDFLSAMLNKSPSVRPLSAQDALSHPWFRDVCVCKNNI